MDGFGEKLTEARKKKGLSQKRLAEILDITPTRLNYWEKNKREPDLFMFKKIIEILDVDANDMLGISNFYSMNSYKTLNKFGKQKADEYINDLSENPKYTNANVKTISDDITEELKQVSTSITKIKL